MVTEGHPDDQLKLLCILPNLLGNRVMSDTLRAILDRVEGVNPTYVLVNPEDYSIHRAPPWARIMDSWHAQYLARRKARDVISGPYDALIVGAWEFVVAFRGLARHMPSAAVVDAVPATVHAQLGEDSALPWRVRRAHWISHQIHHRAFATAVREFDILLPRGNDCAEALQREYGVEPERCHVTLSPKDLEEWTPMRQEYSGPLRLLFVGNDFRRKGGEFLLRLFTEHLSRDCILTIASNDPVVAHLDLPAGVKLLRGKGREDLLPVYQSSDVFVLPTRRDFLPNVLAEALSAGVPCMTTDVGDNRSLVRDGQTGYLMPKDASADMWARHLLRLAADRTELRRLSVEARRFAERELGLPKFEALIRDVIASLRNKARGYRSTEVPGS